MKLRIAAGPAISMAAPDPRRSPVPMEPPTATIAICAADSWWRSPSSWNCGGAEDSVGMQQHSMEGLAVLNVRCRVSAASNNAGWDRELQNRRRLLQSVRHRDQYHHWRARPARGSPDLRPERECDTHRYRRPLCGGGTGRRQCFPEGDGATACWPSMVGNSNRRICPC